MRSLEDARQSWHHVSQYSTLQAFKDALRAQAGDASSETQGLRSLSWKACLLFENLDVADWQRTLAASRSAYNSLRSHFFRYLDNPNDVADSDPLGHDAEMHKDEELRAEILQDVERITVPSNEYFQQPGRQQILLDVLFIFCKLNPDIGYRQGMHEIAGPILFVVESDAVDIGGISKALGEDSIVKTVFDANYIEHDTFTIFGQILQSAKKFYLSEGPISITTRSHHIFDELLPRVDPELAKHLKGLDIVPQVFLIRWIRLLFGREFRFDDVLALWDLIFAEDTSLEIVDNICIAMLLRIRWHLLDADYNNTLSLLLRYPELDVDFPAVTFGLDALYLTQHTTIQGGSFLVLKYTGRPLTVGRPSTPPALQRNITTFAVRPANNAERGARTSPMRFAQQPTNIEALFQNTAKNIYARGEKLGIGKAVRTAMDEVQKKAQDIREAQASSSPLWRRSGNVRLLDHVKELELRNKKLAGLLADAVNELWESQRLFAEQCPVDSQNHESETVQKLSAAIAKVHFVQVCLNEPTLSLDDGGTTQDDAVRDELQSGAKPNESPPSETLSQDKDRQKEYLQSTTGTGSMSPHLQARKETVEVADNEKQVLGKKDDKTTTAANITDRTTELPSAPVSKVSRPLLGESAFSFMLGSKDDDTHDKMRPGASTDGSLFGGHTRQRSSQGKAIFSRETAPSDNVDDQPDEFDISSLRRAKGAKK